MTKKRRNCCCKSWQARNNSANVAAVLNPEHHGHSVHKNCYCRGKKIPPQLFTRPKECVFELDEDSEEDMPTMQFKAIYPYRKRAPSSKYVDQTENVARKIAPNSKTENVATGSKFRPKSNSNKNVIASYKSDTFYTDESNVSSPESDKDEENGQRKSGTFAMGSKIKDTDQITTTRNAEALSSNSFSDFSQAKEKTIRNYEPSATYNVNSLYGESQGLKFFSENHKNKPSEVSLDYRGFKTDENGVTRKSSSLVIKQSERTRENYNNENRKKTIESSQRDLSTIDEDSNVQEVSQKKSDLKHLSDFRKDHYFETHSTEDLLRPVPDHICVHRFGVDDRFLPEALHPDAYGTSRCVICGKPMDNPVLNKVDERIRSEKNIFPRFYKYGLAPKKIYMGGSDKNRIEMELDWQNGKYAVKTLERPNYFNTYALRYQKGVG